MPDLTVTLSNNNTQVDEMRLKQQLDDKVWTLRINNQTLIASIKKNENPNSLLRDKDNKKGIEIFEVSFTTISSTKHSNKQNKKIKFSTRKQKCQ